MKAVEVLVHINARARLEDDKGYQEIARQVVEFKPATRFQLESAKELESANTVHMCEHIQPTHGDRKHFNDELWHEKLPKALLAQSCRIKNAIAALPEIVFVSRSVSCTTKTRLKPSRKWEQIERSCTEPRELQIFREVKPWDRGFWRFTIPVACGDHSEKPTLAADSIQRHMYVDNADTPPWTWTEFSSFWARTSLQIQAGELGMVSMYRTTTTSTKLNSIISVSIRLYCWGITAFKVYAALQWISHELIEQHPVDWIGADGELIVSYPGHVTRIEDFDARQYKRPRI